MKKKVKSKTRTGIKKSKVLKKGRVLRVRKKIKKETEQPTMFDSTKPSTGFLFVENIEADEVVGDISTFADFKNENFKKIEQELTDLGARFCSKIDLPEVPQKPQKKNNGWFRNLFR